MDVEVENEVPELSEDYRFLRYSCMTRNRDNNGNGVIDQDEVRWYLSFYQTTRRYLDRLRCRFQGRAIIQSHGNTDG